jgi:hypothetical protein
MRSHELLASMQVSGGVAEFTVCTANRVYQQQLVEIGFQRTPDDSFARHLSASSDIEYIFENFSRHLEEILLQHAGMRPIRWEEALTEFLKRVEGTEVRWWLAGSQRWRCEASMWRPGTSTSRSAMPMSSAACLRTCWSSQSPT